MSKQYPRPVELSKSAQCILALAPRSNEVRRTAKEPITSSSSSRPVFQAKKRSHSWS